MTLSRRQVAAGASAAVILALTAIASASRNGAPDVPMADVTIGPFVDLVEIRGEIRPFKSLVVTAPSDAGQLQIIRVARDGAPVRAGDVLVEFDASTPRREMADRMTELRQQQAQVDQVRAEARIAEEGNATTLLKADYDVQRARLDLSGGEFLPRLDLERAKLGLADAEQRFVEIKRKIEADKTAAEANIARAGRRVERIQMEIDRRLRALDNLQLKAPVDGVVNIMLNPRMISPSQPPMPFRPGDPAWPGAQLIELPDLTSVHLQARVEESDRGRVQVGQRATIRVDALPDLELEATLSDISVLARPDFTTGFPPGRNFDMKISVEKTDPRLRPGMSATARVAVGRIDNATLVPAGAVFTVDGQAVVYKLTGRSFTPVVIQVVRRGRELVAVRAGVAAGDRLALVDPTAVDEGGAR
ncbi:MAG TPA: efflux RND transporter periplasmic adaptor subunit [Vicinamibacterales bacterium]|nr:efflux RND transporter periplasmic adaptor subunit [Vicinamibacterales bacterium]